MTAVTWSAPLQRPARTVPRRLPAYVPTGIPPGPAPPDPPAEAGGTALQQGQNDNAVTVAPLSLVQPGSPVGDEEPINDAYLTSPVVKLTAGAVYKLLGAVIVPADGKLYINGAVINREMVLTAPGGVIVDDPATSGPPGPPGPAGPQGNPGPVADIMPQDLGFAGWTVNPISAQATGNFASVSAGTFVSTLLAVPVGTTVSTISMFLNAAASGPLYCALYTGTAMPLALLGATADVSSLVTAANTYTFPLTAPLSIAGGTRYAVVVFNAGTATMPVGALGGTSAAWPRTLAQAPAPFVTQLARANLPAPFTGPPAALSYSGTIPANNLIWPAIVLGK